MSNCRSRKARPHSAPILLVVILAGMFSASIAIGQIPGNLTPAPRRTSIIFILADSLGYGDLGCYGQTQIKTPNLDKLVAEGMRFTSCYAGSSEVVPSSATLMLGKNTGHIDIRGDRNLPLQPADVTLPQLLKPGRIVTGMIGHWGLGDEFSSGVPMRKGFLECFAILNETLADDYYPQLLYRSDRTGERNFEVTTNLLNQRGKYANDFFTEGALNFIRLMGPNRAQPDAAYFLYLSYTIARANRALAAKTGNGMEVPLDAPYAGESWPQPQKNKAAMISRLDGYVGTILDKLKELKSDTNTLIIFSSSNGPHNEGGIDPQFFHSAGPFRGGKGDLHEGGIRVPFIAWWPGKIQAGSTSDLPCAFWDVMPTVAEIDQQPTPSGIDGISLLPTLLGQTQTNRHEFLYWEVHDHGFKQAVRMGDWKALRSGVDGPLELYNLKTDPGEKNNVAEANPKIVARIQEYLKTARTEDPNWPAKTVAENSGAQPRR